jgi:hypothetical protein
VPRLARIQAALGAAAGNDRSPNRLCAVATDLIGVTGAGVMLMSGDQPLGSLCSSNGVSDLIEQWQFTLGEGPCVDAYTLDQVVTEPDLAEPTTPRWFAFTPRALDIGVRAVFGFPLGENTARLGALNLYLDRPGGLDADQFADALVFAEVMAHWVIDAQAAATQGSVAEELDADSDFHYVVQNAAGMVSVQLSISVTDALVRIRAYAFRETRLVREVADDVVARRLRFS